MIYDYRDAAGLLPSAMSHADPALPFPERVERLRDGTAARVSAGTLKKRIGALAFSRRTVSTSRPPPLKSGRCSSTASRGHGGIGIAPTCRY